LDGEINPLLCFIAKQSNLGRYGATRLWLPSREFLLIGRTYSGFGIEEKGTDIITVFSVGY
jgi:hypothetical protein